MAFLFTFPFTLSISHLKNFRQIMFLQGDELQYLEFSQELYPVLSYAAPYPLASSLLPPLFRYFNSLSIFFRWIPFLRHESIVNLSNSSYRVRPQLQGLLYQLCIWEFFSRNLSEMKIRILQSSQAKLKLVLHVKNPLRNCKYSKGCLPLTIWFICWRAGKLSVASFVSDKDYLLIWLRAFS